MRITQRWMLATLAAAILLSLASYRAHAEDKRFTDWGWPVPYEKISDKSVAWLQQKGWTPLVFGWQGPFSGQNTINVALSKTHLLKQRGLETKFHAFAAGPDVNEALAAARPQLSHGAHFPL